MAEYVPVNAPKPFNRNGDRYIKLDKQIIVKLVSKVYKGYNFLIVYDAINNRNNYFIGLAKEISDGSILIPCRRDGYGNYKLDCSYIVDINPNAFGEETCNLDVAFVETSNGLDVYSIKPI